MNMVQAEIFIPAHERFALVVSAVCHDIGHPALNNPFLIETGHELAIRYNDKSPLENMHCARLFEILGTAKASLFAKFQKSMYQEVRKVVIEAVLHTDMIHHFEMIKDLQMMYEVGEEIWSMQKELFEEDGSEYPTSEAVDQYRTADSKKLMRNMMLHLADVSNPFKPFKICRMWAWQVLEEFFAQGDIEKELGITVQMMNDRDKVNRANSQIGFIEFLVCPLLFVAVRLLPPLEVCAEQCLENIRSWQDDWLNDTPNIKDEDANGVEARIAKLEAKYEADKAPK